MLLRLRGPDGMTRIEVDKNETFGDLGLKVSSPDLRVGAPAKGLQAASTPSVDSRSQDADHVPLAEINGA